MKWYYWLVIAIIIALIGFVIYNKTQKEKLIVQYFQLTGLDDTPENREKLFKSLTVKQVRALVDNLNK